MATWPGGLPDRQFVGLTHKRQPAKLRSPMTSGTTKVRRIATAVPYRTSIPVFFSNAEKQTFDAFWATTLKEGSLFFDWEDPVTDATVSMEIIEYPDFALSTGPDGRFWRGTMEIEVKP